MRKLCPLMGPKMSAFCMVMSVWGVIFLGLLGVFFYVQAVTLFPDLHFSEETKDGHIGPSVEDIESKYSEESNAMLDSSWNVWRNVDPCVMAKQVQYNYRFLSCLVAVDAGVCS
ncbi:hypothetical protein COOONC_07382 [Cooperia oncophora]